MTFAKPRFLRLLPSVVLLGAGLLVLKTTDIVHAAYALGYAATWTTRWYALDTEAAEMLGAHYGERFIGFISIGTPTAVVEDRPRPALETIVSAWQDAAR